MDIWLDQPKDFFFQILMMVSIATQRRSFVMVLHEMWIDPYILCSSYVLIVHFRRPLDVLFHLLQILIKRLVFHNCFIILVFYLVQNEVKKISSQQEMKEYIKCSTTNLWYQHYPKNYEIVVNVALSFDYGDFKDDEL